MIKYKHALLFVYAANFFAAILGYVGNSPIWLVTGNISVTLLLLWLYLNEINAKHHRPEKCWVNRKPWIYYYVDEKFYFHRKIMKIENGKLIVIDDDFLYNAMPND